LSGKVYAVVKTSNTGGSQPLIHAGPGHGRQLVGHRDRHRNGSNTRAIVSSTSTSTLAFMTGPHKGIGGQSGGDIYEEHRRPIRSRSQAEPARR
jgi:hypothetical protein